MKIYFHFLKTAYCQSAHNVYEIDCFAIREEKSSIKELIKLLSACAKVCWETKVDYLIGIAEPKFYMFMEMFFKESIIKLSDETQVDDEGVNWVPFVIEPALLQRIHESKKLKVLSRI